MSEKKTKKSNGLPTHADWNLDADDKFLRRFKRLVRSAPAHALRRMGTYLSAVVEESSAWGPPAAYPTEPPTTTPALIMSNGENLAKDIELAPETF